MGNSFVVHEGHLVDRYMEGNEKLVMPGMANVLLNHNPNAFDRAAADKASANTTNPASSMLATSENIACCGCAWK
jgi:hypothetical protein